MDTEQLVKLSFCKIVFNAFRNMKLLMTTCYSVLITNLHTISFYVTNRRVIAVPCYRKGRPLITRVQMVVTKSHVVDDRKSTFTYIQEDFFSFTN